MSIRAYQSNLLEQAIRRKLSNFILSVGEVGRTVMAADREAFVRIVNPYQYRAEVRNLFFAEINDVTWSLGPNQRAVITGLDIEVNRVRRGDFNLALYIAYEYQIYSTRR